jgi:hypothetical protein
MSLFKGTTLLCVSVSAREVLDRERKWSTLDEAHSFFPVVLLGSIHPPLNWHSDNGPASQSFFSLCNIYSRALPFLACGRIGSACSGVDLRFCPRLLLFKY